MTGHNRVKYLTRLDTFFQAYALTQNCTHDAYNMKYEKFPLIRKIEFTASINFCVLRPAIKIVWNGSLTADNDTEIKSNIYKSYSLLAWCHTKSLVTEHQQNKKMDWSFFGNFDVSHLFQIWYCFFEGPLCKLRF